MEMNEATAANLDGVQKPVDISDSVQNGEDVSPCALELFAGSCKLSKCLKLHGFAAFGIDHQKCKNRVGPCVVMDLTRKSSRKFLKKMLHSGKVAVVPMAPPCGTSSRARERPIPLHLRRQGVPRPKQLRSAKYPLGFGWLTGTDAVRVKLANQCYETVSEVFRECVLLGVFTFIENPASSRMWDIPYIRALMSLENVFFTVFHSCMHGGDRDKLTGILHNCPQLCALGLRCDKRHKHRPWSVSKTLTGWKFDTASEAEYPLVLCSRMARAFAEACVAVGWAVHPEPRGAPSAKVIPSKWKIASGRQPRGKRAPPLLPEDGQVVSIEVLSPGECRTIDKWSGRSDTDITLASRVFPKGSRLISFQKAVDGGELGASPEQEQEEQTSKRRKITPIATIGIPMTPEAALRKSLEATHPFDEATAVPGDVEYAMKMLVQNGCEYVHKKRVGVLKWMTSRAGQLAEEERKIHESLSDEAKKVVEGKRFLLLGELLRMIDYQDKSLVEDLVSGMRITGDADLTGVFPVDFRPAMLDQSDLWRVAKFAQQEVVSKVPRHMKPGEVLVGGDKVDVASQVWEATIKEVKKGWLDGPLTAEEVSEKIGPLWTPSRRFGIVQSSKVRNIDDLSEFAVNQAYGTPEKLDLGGVDEVVSLAIAWVRATVGVKPAKLRGRCLDLKSAYKQIHLNGTDRQNAVLTVLEPDSNEVKFFISNVLPFGATGSVMSFNRVARALRDLMRKLLWLPIANYFDDFTHIDLEEMADRSQAVMERFLEILGWQIAAEPAKRTPAAAKFVALGVVVDLEESEKGVIKVKNKEERAVELEDMLKQARREGSMPPSIAAKIQGKMNFAESQCCGRWLIPVLEPVKRRSLMPSSVKYLTEEIVKALEMSHRLLLTAPPRRISAVSDEKPCVVFTDGAYENGVASCGVVLVSPRSSKAKVMSFVVPEDLVAEWKKDGQEQVIAQAELLPIMMVKRQMKWALQGARVLYFIDNEGVKEALVSGATRSEQSKKMLIECMVQDAKSNSLTWYARVPSPSNLADAPSRMCVQELHGVLDFEIEDPLFDYREWGKVG